jgi:hypothetical protein
MDGNFRAESIPIMPIESDKNDIKIKQYEDKKINPPMKKNQI